MAAGAVVFIEAVVARVLVLLGAGAVASEAAKEAARRRQEAADQAKASPVARADAQAQAKAKEKCKECPPDKGEPYQRNFAVRKPWVDYQARVTGMPNGPTFIMEWMFRGVVFDGFVSADCLLQEAKAGYDQFFDEHGDPKEWWDGDKPIYSEAVSQSAAAQPQPPVQLRWYFMEAISYRFFSKVLAAMRLPIQATFHP